MCSLSYVHVYRIEYVSYRQGPYRIRIVSAADRIVPALVRKHEPTFARISQCFVFVLMQFAFEAFEQIISTHVYAINSTQQTVLDVSLEFALTSLNANVSFLPYVNVIYVHIINT